LRGAGDGDLFRGFAFAVAAGAFPDFVAGESFFCAV